MAGHGNRSCLRVQVETVADQARPSGSSLPRLDEPTGHGTVGS